MFKRKQLQLTLILIIGILFYTVAYHWSKYESTQEDEINKKYFNAFDDYYEGHIYDIVERFETHTCLIFLKIDSSTIQEFDIRDNTKYYHVIIKADTAEIIENIRYGNAGESKNLIRIGDKIIFDGKLDSMYLYHNGMLIESWKPRISTFGLIDIRNYHRL
jgi:hypothetical protein